MFRPLRTSDDWVKLMTDWIATIAMPNTHCNDAIKSRWSKEVSLRSTCVLFERKFKCARYTCGL